MPTWPATLPAPVYDGYGLAPLDPVARSKIEGGPLAARRRYSRLSSRIDVRWVFSEVELAVFEAWWQHVARHGAAWFDVAIASSLGLTTVSALFARGWRMEASASGTYAVQSALHVRTLPGSA